MGLGSVNTVINYIDYLEKAWLFFVINKYGYSVKEQQIANKKVYAIDTGLIKTIAFSFSENAGALLENIVFLELLRTGRDIYYYKTNKENEVDFYIPQEKLFIQVCQNISEPATRERETRALLEAKREVGEASLLILTEDEKDNLSIDDAVIQVLPIYEWLLRMESPSSIFRKNIKGEEVK